MGVAKTVQGKVVSVIYVSISTSKVFLNLMTQKTTVIANMPIRRMIYMSVVEVNKYCRTLEEIIEKAVENAKSRLKEAEPKQRVAKRTGNKKALHQKSRNKVKTWKN